MNFTVNTYQQNQYFGTIKSSTCLFWHIITNFWIVLVWIVKQWKLCLCRLEVASGMNAIQSWRSGVLGKPGTDTLISFIISTKLKGYFKISWQEVPSILKNSKIWHDCNPYRSTNIPCNVLMQLKGVHISQNTGFWIFLGSQINQIGP